MSCSEKYDLYKVAKLLNRCENPLCYCHDINDDNPDDRIISLVTEWMTSNDRDRLNTIRNTIREQYEQLKSLHETLAAVHNTDMDVRRSLGDAITNDDASFKSSEHHKNIASEQQTILDNFDKRFPQY